MALDALVACGRRLFGFACVLALQPAMAASAAPTRVVLPDSVTPEHYRIEIRPDAAALSFRGSVAIDVTVHEATDRIVLNALDLTVDTATLDGETAPPGMLYDERRQTLTVLPGHRIRPGAHTLSLTYHGRIYEQPSGFFALDYAVPGGKARALFTQFENAEARQFVPCWDEPARKATFELSAVVPAAMMAVSNMPVAASEDLPGDLKRVRFAPTPRMSSYLLFFGLGDFQRVQRTVDGVDGGVIVRRGDTDAAFTLEAAAQALHYYNEYFGMPYPLPKLDLIAGPGASTSFGAMENWGAIFGFENEMLVDPRLSSEADRQRAYEVAAHEIAHQWFGDLVTMRWWDDLWLNEGFADWMESKVTDHFHPDWHIWLQTLEERQGAMQLDARQGTHPIITPIYDVRDATNAFDEIAYFKGSAVIRTLETYLGEDAFREGVRRYIRERAYANAVTDDLWRAMDAGSKHPIMQIAHDLTRQAGVPMISEKSADCVQGETVLALAQGHYAIDADSTRARLWHVPVTAATVGGAPVHAVVYGNQTPPMHVPGCEAVVLNAGQTSYFRSHYSPAGFEAVAAQFGRLSAADQLGLLTDTRSLGYVGLTPMRDFLDLSEQIPVDAAPEIQSALAGALADLDLLFDGRSTQNGFRRYARELLERFFARVGWDGTAGEPANMALLRSRLVATLARLGDSAVQAEARRRFAVYVGDRSALSAAERSLVLDAVAVSADQSIWDQLHQMARSTPNELERFQLYQWLASPSDPRLAQQALDLCLTGELPASIVARMPWTVGARHPRLAFEFTTGHWHRLEPMIEPESRITLVPHLLLTGADARLVEPLEAFARAHIPADARLDVRKAVGVLRYRDKLRQVRLPEVEQWLDKNSLAGAARQRPPAGSQASAPMISAINSASGSAACGSKRGAPRSDM